VSHAPGFPHIFNKHFPYFFNAFSILKEKNFNTNKWSSFFQNFIHGTQCKKHRQNCHQR